MSQIAARLPCCRDVIGVAVPLTAHADAREVELSVRAGELFAEANACRDQEAGAERGPGLQKVAAVGLVASSLLNESGAVETRAESLI